MKAISLFSGAGGDTLGLEAAGIEVVGFVEWEQAMINTHIANFPNSKLIERDVRAVTEEMLAEYVGDIDILFAGFPCQGFSHAGKKDVKDDRNNLFKDFVRIAQIIRPRWIIGENVKHITKMKTSDGKDVTEVIKEAFEEIGFAMEEPKVLKAEQFGVPQKRERCFFVGRAVDNNHEVVADFSWDRVVAEGAVAGRVTLSNILEQSLDNAIEITDDQVRAFGITRYVTFEGNNTEVTGAAPLNLRRCLERGELSFGKRVSPTHSEVVDPDGFSKTLICTYARMPRMFVAIKSADQMYLRPFTVSEAQQIQGFPKSFTVHGTRMLALKQIGNAVPPPIVTQIAKVIRAC